MLFLIWDASFSSAVEIEEMQPPVPPTLSVPEPDAIPEPSQSGLLTVVVTMRFPTEDTQPLNKIDIVTTKVTTIDCLIAFSFGVILRILSGCKK